MRRIIFTLVCGLAMMSTSALPVHAGAAVAGSETPVDFNRDIRPLFAKRCTACHGGVKAAGQVSFLYREKALAPAKSGQRPVVPGQPDQSELIRRVSSKDPDEVMPRPDHGPRLSDVEIATLRRWIQQGAPWSDHWSFVPPVEPPGPKIRDQSWPRTTLDVFILARLEAEGLKPSPPAAPAEWLRRVSLDLTGLPPTPEDYDAFVQASRRNPSAAREQVIDRLLASPQFGERWASMWLDLARYSDTYGYEKDPHRDIWPWRDWVIRALNADLPYDQFTIKQLAGDLLENPTADDVLATAFHRNTQNNTEGGTDDEEFRTVAVLDRVNTTWTVWQATTFGCAQCHSHPYDPFPQRDYYRFAALFNNTEDCDQNDDFPKRIIAGDPARREESWRRQRESARQRTALNDAGLAVASAVNDWQPLIPLSARTTGGNLKINGDGRMDASGTLPVSVQYTVTVPAVEGMTAFKLDLFPDSNDAKRPPERGQILSKLTANLVVPDSSNQVVQLREVIADYLTGPRDPRKILDGGGGLGSYPVMTSPRWGIVVLQQPLRAPNGSSLELVIEHGIASNSGFQGCPLKHFALSYTKDSRLTDFVGTPARAEAWQAWRRTRDQATNDAGTSVPVMMERPRAATRETRVFIRGNRLTRDEPVMPGVPAIVRPPPQDDSVPFTRLSMALWLVSDRNPLAARVLANRLWAEMFGRGLVETLEDFGTSGAKPSHPELLDHLALRLRGPLHWSIKQFLREVALSSAYGQSARATPKLLEKDRFNRLLARGPHTRLTAEMVRDQALAVSGLLSLKQFGPPVYPPQPDGVWSMVYNGEKWETSKGEDRFRRAIYTYCRRTSGYPMFLTFDAPMRDVCTARRLPSNTPLQALGVLNDPAFLEMARALAARVEKSGGSPRDRIATACRILTLAPPPPSMVDSLLKLYQGALADCRAQATDFRPLAQTPEAAAMVLVANTLFNLDPFLNR